MTAAEELRREFEAATSVAVPPEVDPPGMVTGPDEALKAPGPSPEPAPGAASSAAEELERELAALRPLLTSTGPPAGAEAALQPEGDVIPAQRPEAPATPAEEELRLAVPDTYSGRVYLMFPSSLGQDELGSVWEILEEVAGSETIVDNRLVSREAGIQFTLDLGEKVLSVEGLKQRMPGAGLQALEEDRLKVDWPRRA